MPVLALLLAALGSTSPACAQTSPPCRLDEVEEFSGGVPPLLPSCAFPASGQLPPGWSIDPTSDVPWHVWQGATPSVETGPAAGRGGPNDRYLYVEASPPFGASACAAGSRAIALGPCFDVGALSRAGIRFWWHQLGPGQGSLALEADSGTGWQTLWIRQGDAGDHWHLEQVSVDVPGSTLRIRFVGTLGADFRGDIAIDGVQVGAPSPRRWQVDAPAAALRVDGIRLSGAIAQDPPTSRRLVTSSACGRAPAMGSLEFQSDLARGSWEVGFSSEALRPIGAGAIRSPGDQYVHLDITRGIVWMNGGSTSTLAPLPGAGFPGRNGVSVRLGYRISQPVRIAMQALVEDPSAASGLWLSQASQLDVRDSEGPVVDGPDQDDASVRVPIAGPGDACFTTAGLDVFGVTYDAVHVSSNGRITLGRGDPDLSPSLFEAANGVPFLAPAWTDLDPSSGGRITVRGLAPDIFEVRWFEVPHYGTTRTIDLAVVCDADQGIFTFEGFANSQTSGRSPGFPGINLFVGLSPGGGAQDPGGLTFAPGAMGTRAGPGAMVYGFHDAVAAGGSGWPAGIDQGTDAVTMTALPGGGFDWSVR